MEEGNSEEKLVGGNVSDVYRLGKTVRREMKPESPQIHQLLNHLEKKGYHYAPKFLGMDDKDREILTFIEGVAGNYPLKKYMLSDDSLKEIGKMLRLYHEAVIDFPFDDSWQPLDLTPQPFEVLCHNDFAVYNIIFNEGKPAGIIDFDVAGPGPRLWDVAYTLYTCVPLSRYNPTEIGGEKVYYDPLKDSELTKQRIKIFFEAYGEKVAENVLEMVILRLEGLCKTIERKAVEGDSAFQVMMAEGHVEHYQKEIHFIRENRWDWI
ncbi:aminoglycoside phosphotransferase family protein [Planomicrobium sp. Y74]|uniref:phosphotransferase n=1 Tax=Planomicrobium sp. Y74 TaxID=2478977 RepID=UPI000EF474DA|nr:aminoglycoside phosphotransferase family protein [Planomicrobium sp. Y74]RLQ90059.1 aminoglycoside phosphotransferase family protein [Planomicrobium sp. Y74]